MYYENMPLYPGMRPPCDPNPCMRVRLFDDGCTRDGGCCRHAPPMRVGERVMIDNPCRAGERAEVVLGVDDCGNLVICVHRLCGCERPCRPERPCCSLEPCRPQRPCQESGRDPCAPWPEPRRPRRRHRPDWACCR